MRRRKKRRKNLPEIIAEMLGGRDVSGFALWRANVVESPEVHHGGNIDS
jgi:hypothetical protein